MFENSNSSVIDLNSAEAQQILAQNAFDRQQVENYGVVFAAIPYHQVFDQIDAAAKQTNMNALEAGLRHVANLGDIDFLQKKLCEITPIFADIHDDNLQRRMLSIILSLANTTRNTELMAYAKCLLIRRNLNDASSASRKTTLHTFISLMDFRSDTVKNGEDPREHSRISHKILYADADNRKRYSTIDMMRC